MSDDGELYLPAEAIKEIDSRRGWMSRSNYVWALIDGNGLPGQDSQRGITHEEFEEFRQEVKDLVHTVLDFALRLGVKMAIRPNERLMNKYPNVKPNGRANITQRQLRNGRESYSGNGTDSPS